MKQTAAILKRALMIWGAVSLLGMIIFFGTVGYQLGIKNAKVEDDDQDVRFVHEWFGLGHDRDAQIVHSHNPTGSWSGDYEKAFAIKLVDLDESEIVQRHGVSRGDELTATIRGAVEFVTDFTDDGRMPWFPKTDEILSKEYFVYPVRMVHQGTYPDAVHILFIRPADKMAFFAAVKI